MPRSNLNDHQPLYSRLLPLSIALISSAWIFLLHVYLPPERQVLPWALIGLAFLLLLWRSLITRTDQALWDLAAPSWVGFAGFLACILVFLIFPYPYNIGAVPLGIGWMLLASLPRLSPLRLLSNSLLRFGLILLVSAALLPLFYAWAARVHELSGPGVLLTPAVGWLLKVLGLSADFITGGIYLRTFEDVFPQTVTVEKLLPLPLFLFTLLWSGVVVVRAEKSRVERLLLFWLLVAVYAVVRIALLLLIMIQRVNPSYFWDPIVMTFSVFPLAFLVGEPEPGRSRTGTAAKRSPVISLILGFIFAAAAVAALAFRDPGTPKSGRIMINEHGSDWEWTTEPLNTTEYNEKTTYNYYCLAEWLKNYYDVNINFDPLSPQILQGVDVLILKIPTQPYAPEEMEAVVNYVHAGGSLWIIGDHTNVFGSSSFFNPLLRRFGFSLNYTSTHDLKTGNLTLYRKPSLFAHPTVINLPPYLFGTSCSMNAPWSAESAIIGYGMRADRLDYSQKNFFADRNRKQFNIQFGLFLQQAARRYGKGRILIYTDSTTFSNFFVFIKGKPELVLGSLEWLNRRPSLAWLNLILIFVALIALVALFVLRFWNGAALAGILIGVSLSAWTTDRLAHSAYPLPQPNRTVPWLNFERDHCHYFLPTLRLVQDKEVDYLTFYVWTQRVGAVPREMDRFAEAVSGGDPLVMIDPTEPFSSAETSSLREYLNRGGRLLLINSADNPSAASANLLDQFGLRLRTYAAPHDSLHTLTLSGRFFPLVLDKKFSSVTGGETFLKSDQGDVIGTTVGIGRGRIWALSCGHLFRNSSMGQTSVIPDEGLRALYDIEFDLIRRMLARE